MGRKKKKPIKPWCWYCNREFDDDKILAQHQRAKHFKCPFCHKKLYSGPGLTVHCIQVHKERLDKIPEALPNRNSVDIDIYGMQGVPEEDIREHERLKRGDDSSLRPRDDRSQQSSSQLNKTSTNQQLQATSIPMHAAMFQHAMAMGAMPPAGFPIAPAGMPVPPPGFPIPPGFSTMLPPPQLQLGMPPNFAFPGMLPTPTMANIPPPPLGFPPAPPPPPAPPSSDSEQGPSSNTVPQPPPMSGVGQFIGIPPPDFNTAFARPPQRLLPLPKHDDKPPEQSQTSDRSQSSSNVTQPTSSTTTSSSTSTTIAKPAMINPSSEGSTLQRTQTSDEFIDLPSTKMRIMHPNSDLSLEELRLKLTKYQDILIANEHKSSQEAA